MATREKALDNLILALLHERNYLRRALFDMPEWKNSELRAKKVQMAIYFSDETYRTYKASYEHQMKLNGQPYADNLKGTL